MIATSSNIGPPPSNDEDVSKLYSIFRNNLRQTPPKQGWGKTPGDTDNDIADDMERIRLYRNKIYHCSSLEITTETFNKDVLDLIRVTQSHVHIQTHTQIHTEII